MLSQVRMEIQDDFDANQQEQCPHRRSYSQDSETSDPHDDMQYEHAGVGLNHQLVQNGSAVFATIDEIRAEGK